MPNMALESAPHTWVTSPHVQAWLAQCLHRPARSHDAQAVLPEGGLTVAHVHELVELVRRARAGRLPGSSDEPPFSTENGAVLHCWLYHLSSGADAKLQPPSLVADEETRTLRKRAAKLTRARDAHLAKVQKANDRLRGARTAAAAAQAQRDLDEYDQELCAPFTADSLRRLLSAGSKVAGAAPAPPPPPPPSGDDAEAERKRRACRWWLAAGTHSRLGAHSPFLSLRGCEDVMRLIVAHVEEYEWQPRPQQPRAEVVALRRQVRVEFTTAHASAAAATRRVLCAHCSAPEVGARGMSPC